MSQGGSHSHEPGADANDDSEAGDDSTPVALGDRTAASGSLRRRSVLATLGGTALGGAGLAGAFGTPGLAQEDEETPTATLTVTVENEAGNAIEADVTLGEREKTGSSVDFSEVEVGEYTVTANADNYEEGSQDVSVTEGGTEVTLTLQPVTVTLTVNVEDPDGKPIEEATVSGERQSSLQTEAGKTTFEKTGSGTLTVENVVWGDYTLEADADGYKKTKKKTSFAEGEKPQVTLTFPPVTGSLDITVNSSAGSEDDKTNSLEEALVTIRGATWEATTDEEGQVTTSALPVGNNGEQTYTITATKGGYATVSKTVTLVEGSDGAAKLQDNDNKEVTLTLGRHGTCEESTGTYEKIRARHAEGENDTGEYYSLDSGDFTAPTELKVEPTDDVTYKDICAVVYPNPEVSAAVGDSPGAGETKSEDDYAVYRGPLEEDDAVAFTLTLNEDELESEYRGEFSVVVHTEVSDHEDDPDIKVERSGRIIQTGRSYLALGGKDFSSDGGWDNVGTGVVVDNESLSVKEKFARDRRIKMIGGNSTYFAGTYGAPYAVTYNVDNKYRIWNVNSGKQIKEIGPDFSVMGFSPSGSYLVTTDALDGRPGKLRLYEKKKNSWSKTIEKTVETKANWISFSHDEKYIYIGSERWGKTRHYIIDTESGQEIKKWVVDYPTFATLSPAKPFLYRFVKENENATGKVQLISIESIGQTSWEVSYERVIEDNHHIRPGAYSPKISGGPRWSPSGRFLLAQYDGPAILEIRNGKICDVIDLRDQENELLREIKETADRRGEPTRITANSWLADDNYVIYAGRVQAALDDTTDEWGSPYIGRIDRRNKSWDLKWLDKTVSGDDIRAAFAGPIGF